METRSNILLVAIVGGLLLAGLLAFTYYLGVGTGSYDARYEIRFSKSVSGLTEGAPVAMQGVTVGRVETIELDPLEPGSTRVVVAVNENLPLYSGVRADISRAFMDGSASVMLLPSRYGPRIKPDGNELARIEAVGGGRNRDPAAEAMEMTGKLDKAVESLDAEGQARISQSIARTVDQTAGWERDVSRFFDGFPKQKIKSAARGISNASKTAERLNRSMQSADDDIAKVRGDIRDVGEGAEGFAKSVDKARPGVWSVSGKLKRSDEPVRDVRRVVEGVKDKVEPINER